jgi:hypothetical protein
MLKAKSFLCKDMLIRRVHRLRGWISWLAVELISLQADVLLGFSSYSLTGLTA